MRKHHRGKGCKPVVIGVCWIIARFYFLQEADELGLIHLQQLHHAALLHEVECQHGQSSPRGGLGKPKDVKLPVVLCILQCIYFLKMLQEVEYQHGQSCPQGGLGKIKDVKLPVVFCILQCTFSVVVSLERDLIC